MEADMKVNTKKRFWIIWNTLTALALTLQIALSGCLTPEQQAGLQTLERRRGDLQLFIDGLDKEILLIKKAIADGKIDLVLGTRLVAGLVGKKDEAIKTGGDVIQAIKDTQALNVPWWSYIPSILAAIAGIGGTIIGTRKVGTAARITTTALGAFGAVSRAADSLGATPGEAAPDLRAAIEAEIKLIPGLSIGDVKKLHSLAKSREETNIRKAA